MYLPPEAHLGVFRGCKRVELVHPLKGGAREGRRLGGGAARVPAASRKVGGGRWEVGGVRWKV